MERTAKQTYSRYIWWALLLFSAAMLLNKLLLVVTFRYEIAGLEPYFSYLVLKADSGQLFSDPEQYPFIVTQYSPLYFYLVNSIAMLLEFFGVHEVRGVYITGRSINLLCNLLTCYVVFRFFVRTWKIETWQAGILGLFLFNLFINHNIGVRPDSLKLLWLTLMYIHTYKFIVGQNDRDIGIMSGYAFLALLTKQDALVHVLIALFILFTHRHFLKSVIYGLIIGGSTALVMLLLSDWSFHQVMKNLVGGISQGANFNWFKEIIRLNYLTFPVQIIFLIAITAYVLAYLRNKLMALPLLLLYGATTAALFKWGSNFNYFIDFQLLAVVLIFYVVFVEGKWVGLKWILLGGLILIYFNNFQNKNITPPNLWVERDAYYLFKEDIKATDHIQATYLNDGKDNVICMDLKYALFLNYNSIQWSIVNDHPEIFLEKLEALTDELPVQVFDYNYDCNDQRLSKTVLMAPVERNEWYRHKLEVIFQPEKPFLFENIGQTERFKFDYIICDGK